MLYSTLLHMEIQLSQRHLLKWFIEFSWQPCQKSIAICICKGYFWALQFIPLVCLPVFVPEPHCPSHYTLQQVFKSANTNLPILFFSKIALLLQSLAFPPESEDLCVNFWEKSTRTWVSWSSTSSPVWYRRRQVDAELAFRSNGARDT